MAPIFGGPDDTKGKPSRFWLVVVVILVAIVLGFILRGLGLM